MYLLIPSLSESARKHGTPLVKKAIVVAPSSLVRVRPLYSLPIDISPSSIFPSFPHAPQNWKKEFVKWLTPHNNAEELDIHVVCVLDRTSKESCAAIREFETPMEQAVRLSLSFSVISPYFDLSSVCVCVGSVYHCRAGVQSGARVVHLVRSAAYPRRRHPQNPRSRPHCLR